MKPKRRMGVNEILAKHRAKIESQIQTSSTEHVDYSQEYLKFKKEMTPENNRYERLCKSVGNILKLKISEKDSVKIKKQLDIAHLDVEPWQSLTLSLVAFLSAFVLGILVSFAIFLIKGQGVADFPFLFLFLVLIFSGFLFYVVNNYPSKLANKWRLKASSQMVPLILYVVVYMRHTANLEKAIAFASEHLQPPLSLDFKKVFYNVQIGKFSTIRESLDNYLETWRDYSREFIEAFHLIEGSLFEPNEAQRIKTLEKALQVVLDGVYSKMLKFTHDIRSPLTSVYMLGVVLPTLGLALLPLASAMLQGMIASIHVFVLFNLIIPFLVFYMTDKIMAKRPGGYGEAELLEKSPYYSKYKDKSHYYKAFLICLPFLIIGLLPLSSYYMGFPADFSLSSVSFLGDSMFFDFKEGGQGPFGVGALVLSLFIPIGIALFFSISYGSKTKEIIKYREATKQLEKEFNSSLFQLGNRVGNGVPPELAFGKVAETSEGLKTGEFFKLVNYNIQKSGMSVQRAIFDKRRGAILHFPSQLIATSMRIFIESTKKGLKIAAVSLMSISEYMKNIEKISARLRDMLAETISDMKSNMTFLAPLLAGVVVGLSAMIASILNKLNLGDLSADATTLGSLSQFVGEDGLFHIVNMIPPYFLQIAIGIYLIQIVFILTSTLVTIDSGEDKLERANKIAKNLKKGILLYGIVALFAILGLFVLSSVVLGGLG